MKKNRKAKRIIKITAMGLCGVILIAVITAGIVLYGRIATVMSVKHVGGELYTIRFQQNYHLDKALQSDIRSEKDLMIFVCDEMFFGYRVKSNMQRYACSAYLTESPDGKMLVGRNLDFDDTETLSVYTDPADGFASIGTADLGIMGVGIYDDVPFDSVEGKVAMLAAPYLCMDGVNEKGLSVSVLDLDPNETHEETDRPELFTPVAVRLLLDRAADVDEAIEMLSQYDMHTGHGWTQHLFIADKSGRAVVAEWHYDELKVTESPVCTNFRLSAKALNGDFSGQCERFDTITERLEKSPQNDTEEAMDILKAASVEWTQWSCVFNLDDFTVDYSIDGDYDTIYSLSPEDY